MATSHITRLYPEDIRIDNVTSTDWTIVDIPAEKIQGYLPNLSAALARRHINIAHINFDRRGKIGHVRLFLHQRYSGKISSVADQRELRLLVGLILQFAPFLSAVPDPAMALGHFEQFVERVAHDPAQPEQLCWLWKPSTLKALATVLGHSHFLWEDFLHRTYVTHLPVLRHVDIANQHVTKHAMEEHVLPTLLASTPPTERQHALNTFKEQELFRICLRHLLHPDLPFGTFAEELTDLAEVVVAAACHLAHATLQVHHGTPRLTNGRPCPFAIFGLRKFGGHELGYGSDLGILCVYGGQGTTDGPQPLAVSCYAEKFVQHIHHFLTTHHSGIFALDVCRLPYGCQSSLATSRAAFQMYYHPHGPAALFERQALIKLRWIAGDAVLGQAIEAWRDRFVYSSAPCDLQAIIQLRQRQLDELVPRDTTNIKYSPGGLVDLEYTVQSLQLRHGSRLPTLRTTNTLHAISELHCAGLLPSTDAQDLATAYRFLHHLIDALRVVRGQAHDVTLPTEGTDAFIKLARRLWSQDAQNTPMHSACMVAQYMQRVAYLAQKYGLGLTPLTP